MISQVSQMMINTHKENGMHGPLVLKFPSEEAINLRKWTADNAAGEVVWWCDRDGFLVMARSTDLLVQLKLMFMDPA